MPLHIIVFTMLMAAIKRVMKVWIGGCDSSRQVLSEIRDMHGPDHVRTGTRQVTFEWNPKNCEATGSLRLSC